MWAFDAIGTRWQIDSRRPVDREAVMSVVRDFDRTWSRFRTDSVVARLREPGTVDLGPDAPPILDLYDRLYALTDGAVSPAIGASLERLGYDAQYTLTAKGEALPAFRWPNARREDRLLTVDESVVVDIGAVGKGYLAERVAEVVGAPVTVDAGGDIVHRGTGPLRVAMEHPRDPSRAIGIIDLPPGRSVCASAVNRRAWAGDLHHVLDARTGTPAREVLATWVVSEDAALADGLSTALFFTAAERVLDEFPEVGCAVVDNSLRVLVARLPAEIFR